MKTQFNCNLFFFAHKMILMIIFVLFIYFFISVNLSIIAVMFYGIYKYNQRHRKKISNLYTPEQIQQMGAVNMGI